MLRFGRISDMFNPFRAGVVFSTIVVLSSTGAASAAYPDRPIKLLATTAPGAAVDITARFIAEYMSRVLKQQVIVQNEAGGGGNIALGMTARAPADGYSLVITSTGFVASPFLMSKIPYDPIKSFAPVSEVITYYNMLVTNPEFPAKNMGEYIAYAKAHPDEVTLGSGPVGGQAWVMTMKLNKQANIGIKYLAYKGSGPAIVDLLGGHIDSVLSDPPSMAGSIKAGKLRVLALTSPHRSKLFPDIPTIAESVPGYEQEGWNGIFAPAGTPSDIVHLLSKTVADALQDPKVKQAFTEADYGLVGSTPEQFAAFIKAQLAVYKDIITSVGVHLD